MTQRFQKEFAELSKAIRGGFDGVANRGRIERQLGLGGLTSKDVPGDWPTGDREHLVWRARMFAKISEEVFESFITAASRHRDSFSFMSLRKQAMKYIADREKAKLTHETITAQGIEVYQGDIRALRKLHSGKPATAIITDPPYEEKALDLWRHLAEFASAPGVLRDHGWLVAMSGQRFLPDVLKKLHTAATAKGVLRYCTTMAMHMPGGQSSSLWIGKHNAVNTYWKPVFVYSKGEPSKWPEGLSDFIVSKGNEGDSGWDPESLLHKWGQNLDVCKLLVEKFAPSKALVVDPFLGGGTVALAAQQTGRAFEGFDVLEQCVIKTTNRLAKDKK